MDLEMEGLSFICLAKLCCLMATSHKVGNNLQGSGRTVPHKTAYLGDVLGRMPGCSAKI